MTNQSWEFYIAGVQHHEARSVISELTVDGLLNMVPEPTNKFDPNAIRLEWYPTLAELIESSEKEEELNGTMLGYIPAKISADVSAFIEVADDKQIVKCTITELNPELKPWEWIKVKIDV